MTLIICWILFPLVLGALCIGCGALLERIAGFRLPGALSIPVGLATLIVIAMIFTATDATAELAGPAVVIAAITGLIFGQPWRDRQLDRWALAAAVGVFAVYAAPVVLSGEATFAGYIKLDDAATWFALTDRVMEHGPDAAGLAQSSYEATLHSYLTESGYPVGAFLPLGVGHELVRQDLAWIFQPYLAFLAAVLSLGIYALVSPLIERRWSRALTAFVAAQPALLFGYGLWGGVKELAAIALMPPLAMLAGRVATEPVSIRRIAALAVICVAMLSVVSVGALVWVAPVLAGATLVLVFRRRWRTIALGAVALIGIGLVLSLPLLLDGSLDVPTSVLTNQDELGNLAGPLDQLQVIGIWPNGDFRYQPDEYDITKALMLVAALSALAALLLANRRKLLAPVLFLVGAGLGCIAVNIEGSPWADGKALATSSPALLTFAMLGAALMLARHNRSLRVLGAAVALAITFGVLWSNVLAYHEVSLAPRAQLHELEDIGHGFKGQGPALMTEYSVYGVRHFLRELDAEGASELRRRQVRLRDGTTLAKGDNADIDKFDLNAVLAYRTLVLRNTPLASRPPLPYELVREGRYYAVWQRPPTGGPSVVEHLPLGDDRDPGGTAKCSEVKALAGRVPPGGYLAAAPAPPVSVTSVSRMEHPNSWTTDPNLPGSVFPGTSGKATGTIAVERRGNYGFWIAGGYRGELTLTIDGRQVASRRGELNNPGIPLPLGETVLTRGTHDVVLDYQVGGLHPGSDGNAFPLGLLVAGRQPRSYPVEYIPVAEAGSLCGRRLDWIEAIAR